MKAITVITGILFAGVGVFSIANAGLPFAALAFIIGIAFIVSGFVLCFSYRRLNSEVAENVHWILMEGLSSLILGIIILTGYLEADLVVLGVIGMWVMISGIRTAVVSFDDYQKDQFKFNYNFIIGIVELVVGVLSFFNQALLGFSVVAIVGVVMICQGLSIVLSGLMIKYQKPDALKTKEELLEEAKEQVEAARSDAKEALQAVREAKENLSDVENNPSLMEQIDEPIEFEPIVKSEEEGEQ
ncbi:MAG: DUF308 domain-containing protein [Clostridia bacterium]|nr:DUF308 domain-containing protein [Clostridia bacterium]